jgi:hypothetical protein
VNQQRKATHKRSKKVVLISNLAISKTHKRTTSGDETNFSGLYSYIEDQEVSYVERQPPQTQTNRNLPYQDTFDNGGTDVNEPLASARYKNSVYDCNDSVSTEKSQERNGPKKVRHHRNVSHCSYSSQDSEFEKGEDYPFYHYADKALMKHSQSVLQFKDRDKVYKKKVMR